MMEYNNIRADEDRADKYNAMIIALALFCVGFIVAAFLGQNDFLTTARSREKLILKKCRVFD